MAHARPRVDSMQPAQPGATRTAEPRPPDGYPTRGRYPSYLLFGSCGAFLILGSLGLLLLTRALGQGPEAYAASQARLAGGAMIALHVVTLVALVWFTLRFFRLFPKTQPPKMGPAPRPPDAFFAVVLNGAFLAVTAAVAAVLWGALL